MVQAGLGHWQEQIFGAANDKGRVVAAQT